MNNFFYHKRLRTEKDSKGKCNKLGDIIKAFESHPSIEKIKKALNTTGKLSFHHVTNDEVQKFIMKLDGYKAPTPL